MTLETLKFWGCVALVAAVVASAHVLFVVRWAAKRDATIWNRLSMVDGRLMSVEGWKTGTDTKLREIYGEADDTGR